MEELKLKVSEFAQLVGCSSKTVYKMVENNQLKTENEIQNGRSITLIVTNNAEISEFQKIYGKLPVNNGNYEDILTVNEVQKPVNEIQNTANTDLINNVFEKIMEVNNQYNERLEKVNNELITYKSKQLLLEDKASREGLYLQEIKDIKASKKRLLYGLLSVIVILFIMLITVTSVLVANSTNTNNSPIQNTAIEKEKGSK